MNSLVASIRAKAGRNPKRIVLPETEDRRTIQAINYILNKKIARVVAIGPKGASRKIAAKNRDWFELIDPAESNKTEELINAYYELRKHKGMTLEEAAGIVKNEYVVFGALLVRFGFADGIVAGASHTTPDVVRTTIHCIPLDKSIGLVSSAFLMIVPRPPRGKSGAFLFADCGVNPNPNSEQLAGIAISAAELFEKLIKSRPRVALLSYSTKGSAKGELVDRVRDAVARARERAPGIIIDGELQADSAIVPDVAKIKCPGSDVAGRANVLIFQNLDSGNISYKLVQRLANARAIGPLLLGTTKPASDLSRGCSSEDIADAVAITSLRAE